MHCNIIFAYDRNHYDISQQRKMSPPNFEMVITHFNCFWLGFTSHQHCKRYMATSQLCGEGKPLVPVLALFQARAGN